MSWNSLGAVMRLNIRHSVLIKVSISYATRRPFIELKGDVEEIVQPLSPIRATASCGEGFSVYAPSESAQGLCRPFFSYPQWDTVDNVPSCLSVHNRSLGVRSREDWITALLQFRRNSIAVRGTLIILWTYDIRAEIDARISLLGCLHHSFY